jgi:hypothetical protein
MSRFTALEEQNPEKDDYDCTEELGDDLPAGATSYPTS